MSVQFICVPCAVQKECSIFFKSLGHVIFVHIGWIMTCNKVRILNEVWALDLVLTESQMGYCDTTGFLGVIREVSLSIHVGVVTDDLDGRLVGTYCTV